MTISCNPILRLRSQTGSAMWDSYRKNMSVCQCIYVWSNIFSQGKSIRKKQDLHRQCEANRAYAHYRWWHSPLSSTPINSDQLYQSICDQLWLYRRSSWIFSHSFSCAGYSTHWDKLGQSVDGVTAKMFNQRWRHYICRACHFLMIIWCSEVVTLFDLPLAIWERSLENRFHERNKSIRILYVVTGWGTECQSLAWMML